MVTVPTVDAEKHLSLAGESVHTSANRARLARVVSRNFSEHTPMPGELVGEELSQEAPTLIEDTSGKSSFDLHHVADLQILNHDRAVALSVVMAELVAEVLPLPPYLAVEAGDTRLCFSLILRSLLSPGYSPLGASKPLENLAVEAGGLEEQAVRVGDHVGDTTVDGHDGFSLRLRGLEFDQTDNRYEPLIPVPLESTGLGHAFEGAVDHGTKVPQLGEANNAPIQSPSFGVRLAQPERVDPLSLPTRTPSELLEAALPSLVQLDEKLSAYVARDICQPRKLPTKLCQFVDLIERGWEDPLVSWTGETKKTLLIREVPQEPQGGFPLTEPRDLRGCRVDAVAERLTCDHERSNTIGLSCCHWSVMLSMDFRTCRHVVYNLNAHLVFIPKYRRRVISSRVFESWREVCVHFESMLVESNFEPDHVHLLVKYPPKVALSVLVNSLKGVSARRIRQANFPEVQRALCGPHFWSPSYCVVSCGGRLSKSSSGTSKSKLETAVRTLAVFQTRSLQCYLSQPTPRGAVPPRPKGLGFPAEIEK